MLRGWTLEPDFWGSSLAILLTSYVSLSKSPNLILPFPDLLNIIILPSRVVVSIKWNESFILSV